jgi:hypothetical protein
MSDDTLTQEQIDWRERCKAVSLAHGRYLNALLLSGVFFLAMADKLAWRVTVDATESIPFLGIALHAGTVLVAGVLVLSLILHASLGTFPAYTRAHIRAAHGLRDDLAFERLEVAPSAVDFIVYLHGSSASRKRPGLLIYPFALWLIVVEIGSFALAWLRRWDVLLPTQRVLVVLGIVVFLLALPRVVAVTRLKLRHAFPSLRAELAPLPKGASAPLEDGGLHSE